MSKFFRKLLKLTSYFVVSLILITIIALSSIYLYQALQLNKPILSKNKVHKMDSCNDFYSSNESPAYPENLKIYVDFFYKDHVDRTLVTQSLKEGQYRNLVTRFVALLEIKRIYTYERRREYYLNSVYLGTNNSKRCNIYGFNSASRYYFNKDLKDLEPSQMILLVGLTKGPSFYNPRLHPDNTLKLIQGLEQKLCLNPDIQYDNCQTKSLRDLHLSIH